MTRDDRSIKIHTIVLACLAVVALSGTVAGYVITFTVDPAETMAGGIVTITGTSNIPPGYTDEAILYREVPNFLPKEIGRYPFTITEGGNWGFAIDTTGFSPATYKVQLPKSGDYPYGSSAVLMQTFSVSAPPQTSPYPTTQTPLPTAVTTLDEMPTLNVPPAPTTSPSGVETAFATTGICALIFAYAHRRQGK